MHVIRPALPGDFLAIAALDRNGWSRNRNAGFVPDGEHVWRIWCEFAVTYVAIDGDSVVGVVVAFPCTDGRYCLHKVLVDQDHRHAGIGSELMEACLRRVDELRISVFLTVDPENQRALELYTRAGFTEREYYAGYYRQSEDRFVLTRPVRDVQEEDAGVQT